MLEYSLVIAGVALVGGLLPLVAGHSDRLLHLFISLATGLFLGVVFLHMLPELGELAPAHGHGGAGSLPSEVLWLCVLVGVVGLWLLENLVLKSGGHGDAHRHTTLGWAAFVGLTIHAFTAGVGLAAAGTNPKLGAALYLSILVHKASEGFSLGTIFLLAGFRRRVLVAMVAGFALITPIGILVGRGLVGHLPEAGAGVLTALAAGTFLFVALCDLLPEVFHHREDVRAKVALLAVGVGLSSLVHGGDSLGWFAEFGRQTGSMLTESAPYLLGGFLLAGIIKVFLPGRAVTRQLGGDGFRSVLLASLYGMPLPLCSCSVIPTAVSLRKSGASKGATSAFLISTPETGVDSISVTYALLDPLMTVVRPLAAFVTALTTGAGVNALVRRGWDDKVAEPEPAASDCCHSEPAPGAAGVSEDAPPEDEWDETGRHLPLGKRLGRATQYAFGPLLDDLTPSLVLGLLLSGLIAALVPDTLFTEVIPGGWPSLLLMLVVGTPMYICAVASTPVAAALIAKGLDPGAALVFLLVGPATNVTTLLVVTRFLGRRILGLYLTAIIGFALVAGALVSTWYASAGINLGAKVAEHLHGGASTLSILCAVALALLLARSARRIGMFGVWGREMRKLFVRSADAPAS